MYALSMLQLRYIIVLQKRRELARVSVALPSRLRDSLAPSGRRHVVRIQGLRCRRHEMRGELFEGAVVGFVPSMIMIVTASSTASGTRSSLTKTEPCRGWAQSELNVSCLGGQP